MERSCTTFKTVNKEKTLEDNFMEPVMQFSRSVMSNSAIPWTAACQASLSITVSWNMLKL